MTKLFLTSVLAIGLIAAFWGCSGQQQDFVLRYRFQPGKTQTYEHITTRNYQVRMQDSIIDSGSGEYRMIIQTTCRNMVNDTTAEIAEVHTWTVTKRNPDDSTKVDSSVTEERLSVWMMTNGRISNIEFAGEQNVTQSTYTQNVVDQGTPVFPSNRLSTGSNWTQTSQISVGEKQYDASTTFQVTGFMKEGSYDCAVIKYQGNMIIPVIENPTDSVKRSGIDHVTTDGTLYFAPVEGLLVKQHEHWTIAGERKKLVNEAYVSYTVSVSMDINIQLLTEVVQPPLSNK